MEWGQPYRETCLQLRMATVIVGEGPKQRAGREGRKEGNEQSGDFVDGVGGRR